MRTLVLTYIPVTLEHLLISAIWFFCIKSIFPFTWTYSLTTAGCVCLWFYPTLTIILSGSIQCDLWQEVIRPGRSPPPVASSAPSAARYVSASQPAADACTPPVHGAAAPAGAAGAAEPRSAPCSPAAAGWSPAARSTLLARWLWSCGESAIKACKNLQDKII